MYFKHGHWPVLGIDKDNRLFIGIYLDKKIDNHFFVFFTLNINYAVP